LTPAGRRRICSGYDVGEAAVDLLTWWWLLRWYEYVLVWPLALITLYLTVKAKTRRGRVAGVSLLVLWFIPFIHRGIGDVYFDYLCKHEAGEFIYRTVDNVEGILQMRPRDGSKDYFDRMANGDIPEDPWGHTNWEAQKPSALFVNPPWSKYRFFENPLPKGQEAFPGEREKAILTNKDDDARVRHYYGYDQNKGRPMRVDYLQHPKSSFGYTWGVETSTLHRIFNVFPGEIRVLELSSKQVLGISKGFYRSRPQTLCPAGKDDDFVYKFVSRVARPVQ